MQERVHLVLRMGPAPLSQLLAFRADVALDAEGALFVGSQSQPIIRMVSTDGATVSTVAGVVIRRLSGGGFADGSYCSTARFRALPSGVATGSLMGASLLQIRIEQSDSRD